MAFWYSDTRSLARRSPSLSSTARIARGDVRCVDAGDHRAHALGVEIGPVRQERDVDGQQLVARRGAADQQRLTEVRSGADLQHQVRQLDWTDVLEDRLPSLQGSTSSSVGASTSTKIGTPSPPHRFTPSSTRQGRWMFKLAAEPKRWISVTAPPWPSSASSPARSSRWRLSTRWTTCSTGVTSSGCAASSKRSAIGRDSTHCRTGTCGMTWSTRWAAVCVMRRAPHDGHNPRRLQLNASRLSWPHSPQRSLRKPCARMPYSRKVSNASLMNRGGSSAPGAGFGVGDEVGRVLLHQTVQRGLLRAVALVVARDAVGLPLRPANGLHD